MIEVTYIDHMGSDERVVDAARVSFAKAASQFTGKENARLLSYLARNGHWTPYSHPQITVHVKAPVFVRTQCFKHKVGFSENEISRRYVDAPPEFFAPDRWRGRASDKKQGSSNVDVLSVALADGEITSPGLLVEDIYRYCREGYDALIAGGVAPELARMVLPQAMMTEWIWTGSLAAFARFCALRQAKDAQAETGEVARRCAEIVGSLFPASWAALAGWDVTLAETGDAA